MVIFGTTGISVALDVGFRVEGFVEFALLGVGFGGGIIHF